jgi:hypothetical protein
LTLMNDPLFLESARELARRALAQAKDDSARVSCMFRRTVAREPAEEDMANLENMLGRAREYYGANR